jgi:phosphatidylglycerophosphate synthase
MANLLTGIRLLLLVPVAWALAQPALLHPALVLGMIVAAILSDYYDGKVARALGTASPRGMLFDHGTDFLFVTSCLAATAYLGLLPALLPLLIVIAFTQYVLDSYLLFRQKQLRMSMLGRWNGVFYFVPTVLIASSRLFPGTALQSLLQTSARYLCYLLIASTIASIVDRGLAPWRKTSH